MRIATYNVEWFEALFDKRNNLLLDNEWSRRHDITREQQAQAIAVVLKRVNPDLILIVEAPNTGHTQNTVIALQNFAKHFGLRQSKAVMGYANSTHQEIAVMYDPEIVNAIHDPQGQYSDGIEHVHAPRFDGKFLWDVNVDGKPEVHEFSKPPLELLVELRNPEAVLRVIGVHNKSKAPHGANNRKEEIKLAVENRRKQLAQCIWLRQRVDDHLDARDPLIVLGDFNDGPGVDGYEALFGRSGVEIVLGDRKAAGRCMIEPNARIHLDPRQGWAVSTARFYIGEYKRYMNALLDYVMLSEDLYHTSRAEWRIWHPFDDPECFDDAELQAALLIASDHFPVSVDMQF